MGLEVRTLVISATLFFFAAFFFWMLFPSKIECSYDGPGHIAYGWFYKYSLQNHLRVPWTNPFMWNGALFEVFHAPLFYALAGLLSLLMNQIIATKLLIFLSYIVSFYAMYALAIEYRLQKRGALLAGIAYAFSNWHLFSTFFRAAYLDVLGYALVPLPFLYAKRGLDKNLLPFAASSILLLLSYQLAALYAVPALIIYILILERGRLMEKRKVLCAAAILVLAAVLFYAAPVVKLKGEGGQGLTGTAVVAFDGGLAFPVNFIIPQWGIRYDDLYGGRFWFFPKRLTSNTSYFGLLHTILLLAGVAAGWRRRPELAGIAALSMGFFLGLLPGINPHAAERVFFIFNLPAAIFIAEGLGIMVGKLAEWKKTLLLGASLLANVGGLGILFMVYSVRSQASFSALPLLPGGAIILAFFIPALYRKRWLAVTILILALEVIPNAINPTMAFPTSSQVDPCAYGVENHESVVSPRGLLCPMRCDDARPFQMQHFESASRGLVSYWSRIMSDTSKCPAELGKLGIKYCFQQGKVTELEPAPFINSTSQYVLERDEPDSLAIRFDKPGHANVRLGYFSFYRAFVNGQPIRLEQSEEGFIEFDNPAGLVELKVVPPRSFRYSYLVSAVAVLVLLAFGINGAKGKGKMEWLLLLLGLAVILAHILIRLFWMVAGT